MPEFPDVVGHVWLAFLELHSGRTYHMGGPNPITWSDIKAWSDLMQEHLKDWEIRAIKALDGVWLAVTIEGADK